MQPINTDTAAALAGATQWLKCPCGHRLAPVAWYKGRTAIPLSVFGLAVWIDRMEIKCPACGQVRRFVSVPYLPRHSDVKRLT